jgi:hypothetical protein
MATFDPKSLLWVPKSMMAIPDEARVILAPGVFGAGTSVDEVLELNDLAMKFARAMTDRLERHKSVALREIMFRQSGHVRLPPGILDVTDHGIGEFEPTPSRAMVTVGSGLSFKTPASAVDHAASLAMSFIEENRVDAFAPIGQEMRPGEPFSGVGAIGLATDPESGLSVRVLRWKQDGRGGRPIEMAGFEIAGGRWVARDFGRGENSFDTRLGIERRNVDTLDREGYARVYGFDYETDGKDG